MGDAPSGRRRALLVTNHLEHLAGSEIVALEIAESLVARGWDCSVAANWAAAPMTKQFATAGIRVATGMDELNAFDYDLVWSQHVTAPLLDYRLLRTARERTIFAFAHLSPFNDFEATSTRFEDLLADVTLANSHETARALRRLGLPGGRITVFHNAAPDRFWVPRRQRDRPRRVLVVSNHAPAELREAMGLLQEHVEVRWLGRRGGDPRRVEPKHLLSADVVVTIGKTVQYALASRTPTFVYDVHGGPGYLQAVNLEAAAWHNFSGRDTPAHRSAQDLSAAILAGYAEGVRFVSALTDDDLARYRLEPYVDLIAALEGPSNAERAKELRAQRPQLDRERAMARLIASGQGGLMRRRHRDRRSRGQAS